MCLPVCEGACFLVRECVTVRACMRTCVCVRACGWTTVRVCGCACVCVRVLAYVCVYVRAEGGNEKYVWAEQPCFCGSGLRGMCSTCMYIINVISGKY